MAHWGGHGLIAQSISIAYQSLVPYASQFSIPKHCGAPRYIRCVSLDRMVLLVTMCEARFPAMCYPNMPHSYLLPTNLVHLFLAVLTTRQLASPLSFSFSPSPISSFTSTHCCASLSTLFCPADCLYDLYCVKFYLSTKNTELTRLERGKWYIRSLRCEDAD